jgi:hypothetical protein
LIYHAEEIWNGERYCAIVSYWKLVAGSWQLTTES